MLIWFYIFALKQTNRHSEAGKWTSSKMDRPLGGGGGDGFLGMGSVFGFGLG